MNQETIEKLAIAEQFAHNAQYAGVSRQAVADGYSSIDALFSAILLDEGIKRPRNHKVKLDTVRAKMPTLFNTRSERRGNAHIYMGGIEWAEIERFYEEWLKSRYEEFEMSASEARDRIEMTLTANAFAIRWIADKRGENWLDVRAEVSRAAYGYHQTETSSALAKAHDDLFSEAEQFGEKVGRKLGVKMASTTNFCGADIIAGDDLTRRIIEQDEEIAKHASAMYVDFCRLMDRIRSQRLELILKEQSDIDRSSALDIATEFMLSMKAKYHGERLSATGEKLSWILSHSIQGMSESTSHSDDE